jgi:hypothetical protein
VEEMTGSRAEVARDINRRVLETAAVFDDHADNHVPFDFVCECGCLERVTISPARYLTLGGAWRDGHCDPNE